MYGTKVLPQYQLKILSIVIPIIKDASDLVIEPHQRPTGRAMSHPFPQDGCPKQNSVFRQMVLKSRDSFDLGLWRSR